MTKLPDVPDQAASEPQELPADGEPRPFNQWLLEQGKGALHGELSERLQELVAAVMQEQKPGSLVLKIKVSPTKQSRMQFVIEDDVKVTLPEPDRGASLFFADPAGNLSRSDPNQPELPFRQVPAQDNKPVREVGGDAS